MENTEANRSVDLEKACASVTEMVNYLCSKAENHNNYKIYTCESRLDTWISDKALYLSNGKKWNDVDDRKRCNVDVLWCYENECRLVVEIDKKQIPDSHIDTVQIIVNGMYDELEANKRIFRAPNSHSERYLASRLASRIEWNLCARGCPKKNKQQKEQTS